MKVKINKNNWEFARQVANRIKLNRIKAKIRWRRTKFMFIWVVSLLIIIWLIRTPIVETNALQEVDVETKSFETIAKFEGYSSTPYFDGKHWSCGYWMKCSETTIWITKEKSEWYVRQRIWFIRDRFDLYKYDDNLEVALISFTYNLGHPPEGYEWFIKHWYINALKNRIRQYVYAGDKKLRWLEKRRLYETQLF